MKKPQRLNPATFFLTASLVLGVLYAVFVPYGAGFDEERHLARIYYMSLGEMMPNFPKPRINQEVFDLSYQRRFIQSPAFDMYSQETLTQKFSRREEAYQYGYKTQSIYSPVIFLPQALIGRALWWKFDFPILPTIMLQRIAGLLIYVFGVFFAIRKLPFGKWAFALLALTPSALYQAATLNGDGFTNAASLLFIAWVLAIYQNERAGVQKRSVFMLAFLMIWLGLAKPGAIILLPLLLLLVKYSFPSKKWIAFLAFGAVLAVFLNVGWWIMAAQGSTFGGGGRQSILTEITSLSSGLFGFLGMLAQSLVLTLPDLFKGWIGIYGFGAGQVPSLVYWCWVPVVLLVWALEDEQVFLARWTRVFLVGMFFFSSLAIYAMVFIPSHVFGGLTALAKHGRYFVPFAPLLLLGLGGLYSFKPRIMKFALPAMVIFFLLSQVFYSVGIYTTYYTYCAYDAYVGEKCILPIYKNLEKEDAQNILLVDGVDVSQTFTKSCGTLEAVEIYINQKPDGSQGDLNFSLLDAQKNILFAESIQTENIRNNDYLRFSVAVPLHDIYEIQLSSSGLLGDGLGIALTPTDFYSGELVVDGLEKTQDLLIHYVCTTP